jgi:plasmid stabilization system protein ParE
MVYVVKLMPRAKRDLRFLFEHIHASESNAALRLYQGLKRTILTLERRPNRCPVTPEYKESRHLLYGHEPHVYRVIYRVVEKKK